MKLNSILRGVAGLALALAVALPVSRAADEKQHSLAEKTSEGLKKLPELQNAKNYAGMLQVVDGLLPQVPPTSYDAAFLLQIKAKVLLAMDQYGKAIEPWEQALKLSDQFGYFEPKDANEAALYIAQIISMEASNVKDAAGQSRLVMRALGYLKRYLENTKKPSTEVQALYANLLYQQAMADQKNINMDLLNQAQAVVEQALLSQIQPKESFYLLDLAILQSKNEMGRATELLELYLKKFPQKKDYWPVLFASYVNLAGGEKDPDKQREYYIRAINTIERAQALGFLKTPKDNYNRVSIYFTAGQYTQGCDILYAGLKNGSIEPTLQNWRILGSYYQQANRELEAINALKEAAKLFPKEGMLDLQIGELYRQLEDSKNAREFYYSALRKGNLEKPQVVYQLIAYTSMELEEWNAAQKAIQEAEEKYPDFLKDQQMKSLADHINNTIKEREEAKKQKEEAQKKLEEALKKV